ncbi:MAG: hypothetical protein EBU43_06835 [Actinobacteria bacterium]|nr:hypothetical protein [Actinomycetota bacterium]NBP92038.1 hypothetical protein [Actinomycetota bacterium]
MKRLWLATAFSLGVLALAGGGLATSWAVNYSQASTAMQEASDAMTRHQTFDTVAADLRAAFPKARLVRCTDGQLDEIHLIAPTPWPHLTGADYRFKAVAIRTNWTESRDTHH